MSTTHDIRRPDSGVDGPLTVAKRIAVMSERLVLGPWGAWIGDTR
jgi:hypothetical protein